MRPKRSSFRKRLVSRAFGVVLVAVSLLGVPSGARLASARVELGSDTQTPVGDSAAEQTHSVYLPSVLRDYPKRTTIFGVQIYQSLNLPEVGLVSAKQAGVSWIRWPISWEAIEPQNTTPDKYYWTGIDAALLAATRAGMKVILTIDSNPSWAANYSSGPIDRAPLSEFSEFMNAVVERYDGDGRDDAPGSPTVEHFEFYNEPDAAGLGSGRWGDYGAEYAQMLCAVAPAMKAANKQAMVLMGGLAYDYFQDEYGPFVREFLDHVLAAGGGQCMDYLVFHYYPYFEFRWEPYAPGLSGKAAFLRSKLQQYGLGDLPMMVTEAGFYSNPVPAWPGTERLQASYLVKFFTQAIAADIKALTWWTWTDLPGYYEANGLLTVDLQPKESYFAFQTAVDKLGTSAFQRRLAAGELGNANVEAYLFQTPEPLYVLWASSDTAQQVTLPGGTADVRDLLDNRLGLVTDASDGQADGYIHLTAGSTPTYVEVIR